MNSRTTEHALKNLIADTMPEYQIITGVSADNRTAPSIRVICNQCTLPDGFATSEKEREAVVLIAAVWPADRALPTDTDPAWKAQEIIGTLAAIIEGSVGRVIRADSDPNAGAGYDLDILIYGAYQQDQATENDESLLVYSLTYLVKYAYNHHA